MPIVERRIIGTVVGVEAKDANACFVEIECEALENATAFQIISTDLSFEHVALNRVAGSRLSLICARGSKIAVGQKARQTFRKLRATPPGVGKCVAARGTRQRSDRQSPSVPSPDELI
jgi:hypothetical protein